MKVLWGGPGLQVEDSICSEWVWSEPSGLLDLLVSNAVKTQLHYDTDIMSNETRSSQDLESPASVKIL